MSAVDYGKSVIVAKEGSAAEQGDGTDVSGSIEGAHSKQELATNIKLGMRMPSFKVLNQSDARPWHFQELLKSNGRWRLVVFCGDILEQSVKKRIQALGSNLNAHESFIRRYTHHGTSIDSLIECLIVHSSPRTKVDIFDFAPIFRPFTATEGIDYSKIYVDDHSYHEGHGQAYENYGIDPAKGCAVILRPDQYVSWVGELDDYDTMDKFFKGFMRVQDDGPNSTQIEMDSKALDYELRSDSPLADTEVMNGTTAGDAPL